MEEFVRAGMAHAVRVTPAECLSLCPRPCGIALSVPGRWTYLFGDQAPEATTEEILRCVELDLASTDVIMPRDLRPKALRRQILGRVPP